MVKVYYEGFEKVFEAEAESKDLFSICKETRFPVPFSCRIGTCGICKIEVLEGLENLSKKTKDEKLFTAKNNERLACQVEVCGEVKIVRSRN